MGADHQALWCEIGLIEIEYQFLLRERRESYAKDAKNSCLILKLPFNFSNLLFPSFLFDFFCAFRVTFASFAQRMFTLPSDNPHATPTTPLLHF